MKKYITKIILFFLLVACVDFAIGKGLDYCLNHLKGGEYYSLQYAMKETKADVLVFGSSRAINHYVPKVIEDSLGMTCYNCGFHAQGIIFQYGRLRYMLNRYKPKMVIYDVEYHFDLGSGENERYLDLLKPYCRDTCIGNYFKEFSYAEYVKNKSRLYQYNSNFVDLLKDYFSGHNESQQGFEPKSGTMPYDVEKKDVPPVEEDKVKLAYLEKFIITCRDNHVPLVMFFSPRFDAASSRVHAPAKELFRKYDIPYYDYFTDSYFQQHKNLFHDSRHLNEEGAVEYTRHIIKHLRKATASSTRQALSRKAI